MNEKTTSPIKFEDLPGIKERELAAAGNCPICSKPLLGSDRSGVTFYKVTITRAGFDAHAVRRRAGLGMMIGALAPVMGPDEDLAKIIDGPHTVFVHEVCAGMVPHLLFLIPDPPPAEKKSPNEGEQPSQATNESPGKKV